MSQPNDITQLLAAWGKGDQTALDQLMPMVYDQLRRRAKFYMRSQSPGHPLQTTALIHEAFLKLVAHPEKQWESRSHFIAVAAQAMRHVLVDLARERNARKRSGSFNHVPLEVGPAIAIKGAADLIALHDALNSLAAIDPRKSRIVELRYFGGLSVDETADVLQVSPATVLRDWGLAKAWLRRELSRSTPK